MNERMISRRYVHTQKEYLLYLVICQSKNYKTTIRSGTVKHFSKQWNKSCFGLSRQ